MITTYTTYDEVRATLGVSDEEIEDAIGRIWTTRDEHYSEIRTEETVKARAGKRIEMSYIGG